MDGGESLERLLALVKLAAFVVPLLVRGPGRPPLPDNAEGALQSRRRRLILEFVANHPGAPVTHLRQVLDLGGGTLYHHLDKLVRARLVEAVKIGGSTRIYPAGQAPPPAEGVLERESVRRTARAVLLQGPVASEAVCAATGFPKRTIQAHLALLVEAGFVQARREGRQTLYSPSDHLGPSLDARGAQGMSR